MAAAATGLALMLPGLIRLPAALTGELRLGCGMYLLIFAYMPLIPFRPLAEAEQRGYLVNLLLSGQLRGRGRGRVAAPSAYAGWGSSANSPRLGDPGGAVFHFGLAWDGIRRHPEVLDQNKVTVGVGQSLWDLGWPTLLFHLSGRLGLTTDEIIVAGLLGPTAVTSFYLSKQVIALVGVQILAVGGATWAGLVDLHFRGERELFVLRFTQLTRLTAILGAGLLLPVAVWNRDLIGLWVGSDRYAGEAVTWLTAWTAWGQALVAFWLWPMAAAGRVRATLPAILCSTAINLGVSLAATAALGLPGPLIGTAVASAGVTWWWTLLLLKRHFGVPPRLLLSAAAAPVPCWPSPTAAYWLSWRGYFRRTGLTGRGGPVCWAWPVGWRRRRADTSCWPGSWPSRRPTASNGVDDLASAPPRRRLGRSRVRRPGLGPVAFAYGQRRSSSISQIIPPADCPPLAVVGAADLETSADIGPFPALSGRARVRRGSVEGTAQKTASPAF